MPSFEDIVIGTTVEVFLFSVAAGIVYRVWGGVLPFPKKHKVLPFQRGVVLNGEEVERVVGPGSCWITPKRTLIVCDTRPKPFQLAGLELVAADGVAIRLSLGVEYQIVDPGSFVTRSSDPYAAFYVELRQAIHIAAREKSGRNLMNEQDMFVARIKTLVASRSAELGVALTQFDIWEMVALGWVQPPSEIDPETPTIH